MHILITGATGFIGKQLTRTLLAGGHTITVVSRDKKKAHALFNENVSVLAWREISTTRLAGVECIIHLAGASINTFPWNKRNKQKIRDSRIETTKTLVRHMPAGCQSFICGSAIGYYPSSGEKTYTTSYINAHPSSFLEQLCVDREAEAIKAASTTTRVVMLRTGLVMGLEKLGRILHLTIKYLGGIILGSGKQRMPCITLDEWVEKCCELVENQAITGPINMVSKNIQHEDYIRELARKLNRPVWCRVPGRFLEMVLGDASQLLLGSWHVEPSKLGSTRAEAEDTR